MSCEMSTRATPAGRPISGSTAARGARVEVGERLVEQQQLGLVQHRPADRHPLHEAARERPQRLVGAVGEPDLREQRLGAAGVDAVQARVEAEVLARGERAVEQRLVGEQADPPAHRPAVARQLGAEHAHAPGVRAQERGEDAQQRRLAGAVGPEHRERRPGSRRSVTSRRTTRSP